MPVVTKCKISVLWDVYVDFQLFVTHFPKYWTKAITVHFENVSDLSGISSKLCVHRFIDQGFLVFQLLKTGSWNRFWTIKGWLSNWLLPAGGLWWGVWLGSVKMWTSETTSCDSLTGSVQRKKEKNWLIPKICLWKLHVHHIYTIFKDFQTNTTADI